MSFNLTSAEPYGSHASAKWQIWAYTSAAPDFIGDFASVKDGNGKVIREGTNGWVCLPFNPMPEKGFKTPHDGNPACADAARAAALQDTVRAISPKPYVEDADPMPTAFTEMISQSLSLCRNDKHAASTEKEAARSRKTSREVFSRSRRTSREGGPRSRKPSQEYVAILGPFLANDEEALFAL